MNDVPDSQINFKLLVWIGFTTNLFTEPHVVAFYMKWAENCYYFLHFFKALLQIFIWNVLSLWKKNIHSTGWSNKLNYIFQCM